MNTKRIIFWAGFIIVLGLIVWGLVVAMNKPSAGTLGSPAALGATDHVRGPANAPVTLIEYGDFQCPACEAYFPYIERLYNESSSTMKQVFRQFPLSQHANAALAAQASEAAAMQGKFWEMYTTLFSKHLDWTELPDPHAVFIGYAKDLGLNVAKFTADLDSDAVKKIITDQQNEGISLGINGTPTFFVNGKAISNPQSYDAFKSIIDAAAKGSN